MPSEIENLLFDLESELEEVRVSACRILAKVGDESTLEALRKATLDTSPSVRYFAGKALERMFYTIIGIWWLPRALDRRLRQMNS